MRWFDNQTRGLKILEFLERKVSVNPNELSERLNVSTKTVRNEIRKLNSLLNTSAKIELRDNRYHLFILNKASFEEIRNELVDQTKTFEIPENRMAYLSDILLNEKNYVLIDDLAFDIAVSRTTLNNDLSKLRKILEKYKIEINGKTNTGLKINGNEYEIRRFILENTFDMVYEKDFLDEDVKNELSQIMKKYEFESAIIRVFIRYLTLSLDRYLNGFEIEFPTKFGISLEKHPFMEVVNKVSELLETKLNITLPLDERLFLLLPLVGMRIPVNTTSIDNLIEIDQNTLELVDKILDVVKTETDLDFYFDESLEEFIYHIYFLCQRLKYEIFIENPVKEEMKNKFSFAWSIAERIGKVIEEEIGYPISEDEIGFLTTYYALFLQNQQQRKRKLKVLVIHQKGGATMRLISYQLKKVLNSNIEINAIANYSNLNGNLDDYDIILTTDHIKLETDKPVIELEEVINEDKLKKQIDEITYTYGLNVPNEIMAQSIILNLLDDSRILIIDSKTSYNNLLKILANQASEMGLADCTVFYCNK